MHAAACPSPARTIRQRSPLIVRSLLTGRAALAQMADDFRTLVVTAGGVVNEDLLVIGWTQQQIDAHGSKARTQALAASVR
jgi:hypothetical protein